MDQFTAVKRLRIRVIRRVPTKDLSEAPSRDPDVKALKGKGGCYGKLGRGLQ